MLEIVRRLPGFAFFLLLILVFLGGMCVHSFLSKERTCWQCGNHNPPHVVFTPDEIVFSTKKHNCKLWHRE
jgi:hypothetical protein